MNSRPLGELFSRGNSIGLMRHILATAVLISHSWPIGYAAVDPVLTATRGQVDVGELSVYGFFVLSGFLITGSGVKFPLGRYAWHRFLRIFPGLWACLIVTVALIAPVVALIERGTLSGYVGASDGPLRFLEQNWLTQTGQWSISGLIDSGAFNGSLWTLKYELACYVGVGILAVTAVLKRAKPLVVGVTLISYLALVAGSVAGGRIHEFVYGESIPAHMLVFGFVFLLGSTAQLYKDRVPMHWAYALAAAAVTIVTAFAGAWMTLGLPAFAYLVFFASVTLPKRFQRIGRDWDYSYGIYIYAFPMQQLVKLLGGAELGLPVYAAISLAATLVFAWLSWHLVEGPAMRLKDMEAPWRKAPVPSEDSLVADRVA